MTKIIPPHHPRKYTWQEIVEIEKQYTFVLSDKLLTLLNKLSEDVGIPLNTMNENHQIRNGSDTMKNGNRNHLNRGGGSGGNIKIMRNIGYKTGMGMGTSEEDVWDNIKKVNDQTNEIFKKSDKIRKPEKAEGIEKIIQEIRISLNKMTDKNYIKQRDEIKEKMKIISNMEVASANESASDEETGVKMEKKRKEEEWRKVGKILFDIASTNKYFSKIYAQLYLELIEEFELFQEIVDTFLEGFISKLQTINYIDPDKDYDGYCIYTKQQDERKAMTGFLVHLGIGYLALGEKGREMVEKLRHIVIELTDKVVDLIDKESKTNEVEEITEILFLFFSVGGKTLMDEWKKGEDWGGVMEKFSYLSKQKVKEHLSLSSRALFKFIDVQKILVVK